eukprot:3850169-Prymnesium_polylepis.1
MADDYLARSEPPRHHGREVVIHESLPAHRIVPPEARQPSTAPQCVDTGLLAESDANAKAAALNPQEAAAAEGADAEPAEADAAPAVPPVPDLSVEVSVYFKYPVKDGERIRY